MRTLPVLVCRLCYGHDAWIVGSAANPENLSPRDYDVQVPFSQWGNACLLLPPDAKMNAFGGWKCLSEGVEIDVWPGELGWVMQNAVAEWAYHPRSGTRLHKEKQACG